LLRAKALAVFGDRGTRPEGQGNSFCYITLRYGLKPLRCLEIRDPALKGQGNSFCCITLWFSTGVNRVKIGLVLATNINMEAIV